MKKIHLGFVVVCSVSLSFLINSILYVNSYTRRSAQDEALIVNASHVEEIACLKGNGKPVYGDSGNYMNCIPR